MRFSAAVIALCLAVLSLGGCAHPRACPPGAHLGPYGQRCFLN